MGALLADLLQGRFNPWHELICRKPAYMPPKPLRYMSVKAILAVVNGIDRRVDRRARGSGTRAEGDASAPSVSKA
jgi:gamma-glutamylputrescine oxidase